MSPSSHAVLLLSCIASAQTRQIIDGKDNTWLVTACIVGTIFVPSFLLFASYSFCALWEGGVLASGVIFCFCSIIRTRWRARHHGQPPQIKLLTSAASLPVWTDAPQSKVTDDTEASVPEQALCPPPSVTIAEPQRFGQSASPQLSLSSVHDAEIR